MQKSKLSIVIFFILIAATLTGCTSAGMEKIGWPQSSVSGDTIFTASDQHVYAINAETGAQIWMYPAESDGVRIFGAPPVLIDDQLIIGGYDTNLYSLDPNTGSENWTNTDATERWISAPIGLDGLILAPNGDSNLYALNSNGAVQWTFTAEEGLWTQPVTDGKSIFVSSMDKNLYSIDPKNGRVQWSVELGGSVLFSLTYAEDGILYVGTINNELLAISADSGRIQWRVPTNGTVWEGVVVDNGTLYAGDQSGMVFALSSRNGSKIWEFDAGAPVIGGPVLTDAGVFFGTGEISSNDPGEIVLLTTNGKKVWTQTVGGKLYSRPVVSGNLVVFGIFEDEKALTAIDENGKIVWSFTPSK